MWSAALEKSQGWVGWKTQLSTPKSWLFSWPRRTFTGTISGFCSKSLQQTTNDVNFSDGAPIQWRDVNKFACAVQRPHNHVISQCPMAALTPRCHPCKVNPGPQTHNSTWGGGGFQNDSDNDDTSTTFTTPALSAARPKISRIFCVLMWRERKGKRPAVVFVMGI